MGLKRSHPSCAPGSDLRRFCSALDADRRPERDRRRGRPRERPTSGSRLVFWGARRASGRRMICKREARPDRPRLRCALRRGCVRRRPFARRLGRGTAASRADTATQRRARDDNPRRGGRRRGGADEQRKSGAGEAEEGQGALGTGSQCSLHQRRPGSARARARVREPERFRRGARSRGGNARGGTAVSGSASGVETTLVRTALDPGNACDRTKPITNSSGEPSRLYEETTRRRPSGRDSARRS